MTTTKGAITMEKYDALAQLAQKKNPNGPHRIRPVATVEGNGEEVIVVLSLPLREIQKARPGTGQRHSVGFSMGPVEFTLPDDGGTFQLTSAWVAIAAR
jgi:hypothetical protein